MKCVRNVFVVWEAFSIWWNQARTPVSGDILASVQGCRVHVVEENSLLDVQIDFNANDEGIILQSNRNETITK